MKTRGTDFFGSGALLLPALLGWGAHSMTVFAVAQLLLLLGFLLMAAWEQNLLDRQGDGESES
ncbi:hypothetical protein [Azospira inquinata]|uniref:Uncharacterized protein n=1 Tax=Azospira inquinata TaxID=2785627 RepID=A0A975XUD4_9RHOO|nr:hypothetical protein [Azospira inquinata]QWT46010.1 hypothetical protein J8L76_14055 [Azospira inquinata]QWT48662.1 hypothetical protein Azoinq_12555 [Azospira inquinata]